MRHGLLGRIALALAAVGTVPVGIASWQLVRVNRTALTTQVLETQAVTARTVAERTGAFVEGLREAAHALAAHPEVDADPRGDAARRLYESLLESRPGLLAVSVAAPGGVERIRAQREGESAASEAALAASGTEALVPLGGSGDLVARADAPLPSGGAVRVVARAELVRTFVKPQELGDEAVIAVGTGDGRALASSDGAATLSAFPAPLLAAARSGRISGSGRYRDSAGGPVVLGAFAPVSGTPWFVASRQSGRVAEAVALRMKLQALVAVVAALLLAALLSALAYRAVVRPIREMARAQEMLAGIEGGAPGADEIGRLRTAFEALERHVRDQAELGRVFLGRYQVLEVLGSGGMGTVFRGYDPKLQREVALKTVRLQASSGTGPTGDLASNLLREAVTVARFSHPNIVSVFDVHDAPGAAFIAMELVDGVSLEVLLRRSAPLPATAVVPLVAAVARGLAAAHAHGILHHDVKPANVLLGRGGAVKVTDFGISQLLSSVTAGGEFVFGSPGYLPPEALRGEGYGPSADLFALGVVAYECLTGRRPFTGRNVTAIVRRTLEEAPTSLRFHVPSIPPEVEALVLSLLAKDTSRRPGDAAAVAERWEAIAAAAGSRWSAESFSTFVRGDSPPSKETHENARSASVDVRTDLLAGRRRERAGRA